MADPVSARMLTLQRRPVPTKRPTVMVSTAYDPVPEATPATPTVQGTTAARAAPKKTAAKKATAKKATVLKFHSRAADENARYLSTMVSAPAPIVHEGERYASIEHAFHAAKLRSKYVPDADPARLTELRQRLQTDGDIVLAKDAKSFGGKTSFKRNKIVLDAAAWNADRTVIMKEIASARALVDQRFADILKDAVSTDKELRHYERGKAADVFWGGDRNTLGRVYTEIGRDLITEGEQFVSLGEEVDASTVVAQPPPDVLPPPSSNWKAFRERVTDARTARVERKLPLAVGSTSAASTTVAPSVAKAQPRAPKGTVSQVSPPRVDEMSFDEAKRIALGSTTIGARLPVRDIPVMRAPAYYLNNRQLFSSFITTVLAPYRDQLEAEAKDVSCDKKREGDFGLMTHQSVVRDYMNLFTPYRGVLIYHGLGAGKTCTSIAIAEGMKEQKIVTIMTPASLRVNYAEELKHCGDPLFRKNQHWEFVAATPNSTVAKSLGSALGIGVDAVNKTKGAWLTDPKKPSNLDTLTPEQVNSLDSQINKMIQAKYRFINYNGINTKHYNEMSHNGTKNPFDNQVIIVDEVHNLVSRIVNKLDAPDSLAMRIYNDLAAATDCRVVFLSGTPIVNYPNEMGVLFNMLRGNIRTYELPVQATGTGKLGVKEMRKILSKVLGLDIVDYRATTRTLVVQCNPVGFVTVSRRNRYSGVKRSDTRPQTDADVLRDVQRELRKNGVQADWQVGVDAYAKDYRALPDTMEGFTALFLDPTTGSTKNQTMLKRRILGLTSYFRSPSEALMPRYDPAKDYHIRHIPMSDYQFGLYEIERAIERKQEGRSRVPKKGGVYKEATSTYRIFSRAFCNFVFPLGIGRPKPSDVDIGDVIDDTTPVLEDDIADAAQLALEPNPTTRSGRVADIEDEEALADTKYEVRIEQALDQLEEGAARYLSPEGLEGLEALSPKFLQVLKEIQSHPDSCQLVYSQFRTIEGIGVLRLILLANGFAEFKIAKNAMGEWVITTPVSERSKPMFVLYTGTETADEKEIIRNAFNGIWDKTPPQIAGVLRDLAPNNIYGQVIRVFMITASGAEGISTYNVRHVHLIEPYWHPVRTEQVIGRAMRICSHQALPADKRTVSVYMYLMTFTENQRIEATKEMLQSDKSRTNPAVIVSSDEALYEISTIKAKINASLLTTIKEAAIDCALYADRLDGENLQCHAFPDASPKDLSFVPSITAEDNEVVAASNKYDITWSAIEITIDSKKYALRKGTKKVYDLASYLSAVAAAKRGEPRDPVLVGILHTAKSGKASIKKPWEV